MPLQINNVISIVKELIEICKDGEQGFKNAADDVKDKDLEKMFTDFSRQRERFMYELKELAKTLGSDMEFSGSILGVLHRRWMDVKFSVAGSNSESILKECIRGESAAIRKYKESIEMNLPEPFAKVIKRQFIDIQTAYETVNKSLELAENKLLGSN